MFRLIISVLLLSVFNLGFSQCDYDDLVQALSDQENTIIQEYLEEVNVGSTLNRGTLEIKSYPKDEHPYYLSNEWIEGSVTYDEVFYPKVPLKYDLVNDELITKNSLGIAYRLRSDKVKNFKLLDHIFLNPGYGESGKSQILEVKNCGPVALYVKWKKEYRKVTEYPHVRIIYEQEQTSMLYKDGTYHKLTGRKSILKPLEDHKKALKAFIREENLYADEMRDQFFSKVTTHYNSIIENQ